MDAILSQNIKAIFGVEEVKHHSKFLGLPSSISNNMRYILEDCWYPDDAVAIQSIPFSAMAREDKQFWFFIF